MSPGLEGCCVCLVGFPRVSGDEPINEVSSFDLEMFSPRERG